jgi:hypothetical protein
MDSEEYAGWVTHPMTRRYKAGLQVLAERESSITAIDLGKTVVLEEVGAKTIAQIHKVLGIQDAMDFEAVMELAVEGESDE